ncbi:hypothetical protein RRG08_048771 [Elysia crispata]|uniref:Uncharacterized protein n=1 Tax=Elysia crispata TaxID=231223 RepID=A0AAE1AN65_9GAST|nr:hypothetical protein RRG08_048771 [Elysia crispata]
MSIWSNIWGVHKLFTKCINCTVHRDSRPEAKELPKAAPTPHNTQFMTLENELASSPPHSPTLFSSLENVLLPPIMRASPMLSVSAASHVTRHAHSVSLSTHRVP